MENNHIKKLREILSTKAPKLNSIADFENLFNNFSQKTLKNIVQDINKVLKDTKTPYSLQIFYDDPFSNNINPYYVAVHFRIYNSDSNYYHNNSVGQNPVLIFQGSSFNGIVVTTIQLDKYTETIKGPVHYLTDLDEDKITKIIINDFIETIYTKV